MRNKRLRNTVPALACALLLIGCAAPTRIASNRSLDYKSQPKRIFLVTDIGSEFGQDYANAFRSKFTQLVAACGSTSRISQISALELDDSARDDLMQSFGPDAILSVRRSGGVVNGVGAVLRVNYDMRLVDVATKKVVWRAEANVVRGAYVPMSDRGEMVAVEVTNKMKFDGLLGACAPVAVSNHLANGGPASSTLAAVASPTAAQTGPKIRAEDMAGKVPYLDAPRQAGYAEFLTFKSPRAFAISDNGHSGRASGIMRSSTEPSDPNERALQRCTAVAGKPCFLYAVDDYVVYASSAGDHTANAAPVAATAPARTLARCQPEFDVTEPTRTMPEVMQMLTCYAPAIHAIYLHGMETRPALAGKLVFRIEIAASGQVTSCVVRSSTLGIPEFEQQLVTVLRAIDFGHKGNRPLIINYPLKFEPIAGSSVV